MRTTSLFWEVRRDRDEEAEFQAIFTLKEHDHTVGDKVFYSLKNIYMSYDHVPNLEYEFAMDVFGSWDHWLKLCKSSMRSEFQGWRDELEIKIKSDALRAMIELSRSPDARGIAAAKYLADKGYAPETKRGRPNKEEVERERKQQAEVRNNLAADMERLGFAVVK